MNVESIKNLFKTNPTLLFVEGLIGAWMALWAVNILEWGSSLTLGSVFESLFYVDAPAPIQFIHSLISMFPYGLVVSLSSFSFLIEIKAISTRRKLILLMGVVLIILIDPDIKDLFPFPIHDMLNYIQKKLYFSILGGPDIGEFTWSATVTSIEYKIFDFYVIVISILFSLPSKDENRLLKKVGKIKTPKVVTEKDWQNLLDSLE